jgi:hypothetical protein
MRVANSHLVSSDPNDNPNKFVVPHPSVPTYLPANTLSASLSTQPVNVLHLNNLSYTVKVSGSVSGAFSVYASNDPGISDTNGTGQGVTNWVAVGSTFNQLNITGLYLQTVSLQLQGYKWSQLQYVHTSGTGTMDVFFAGKG